MFLRRFYSDYLTTGPITAELHHIHFSSGNDLEIDDSCWFSGVQDIIDVATAVNSAQLGISDATVQFKEAMKQSLVVNAALTRQQRKMVEAEIDFEPLFRCATPVVGDHPVVYALRELTRQIYDKLFQIRSTNLPTLVVGSADREVTNYQDNDSIHHYFHDSEAKDVDRTVLKMLNRTAKQLKKNTKKRHEKVTRRYQTVCDIINDFRESHQLPDNYHTKIDRTYTQLVFEDSIYNFSASVLGKLFRDTQASVAYGYGIFPDELLYPDVPQSRLYHIRRHADESLSLTWRNGYSNGYKHFEDTWATIMKNPVIDCGKFCLVVEIVARVGPFAVFKILKSTKSELHVRSFELPEKKKYVRILDLMRSVDSSGKVKPIRSYFSVLASEYFEALNYCLSIDRKSLTMENTLTYTRRRAGGVSLVTKELLCPWALPARDFQRFSFSVYLQAKIISNRARQIEADGPQYSMVNNFSKLLRTVGSFTFMFAVPFYVLYCWVIDNSLENELVLFPDDVIHQEYRALITDDSRRLKLPADIELDLDGDNDDDIPACAICYELRSQLGAQVLCCSAKPKTTTLEMTTDELLGLNLDLACNDEDPQKLADVKERARRAMPVAGFSHNVRMHYIKGGPGCGKSYIIRKLATTRDIIYCPFSKLMTDYKRLDGPDGKYDLFFQTTHRGLEARGVNAMYVDEFTSMPFEYIKMVAYLNGVEDVFIVGDHEQSHVLEGNGEGQYIGNYVDLDELSTHTLMRNFRNPADAVQLLNNVFEYNMQSMSEVQHSFVICGPEDQIPATKRPINKMGFSHIQCERESIGKKGTVRSNQGGTCDISLLFLDTDAGDTGNQKALRIVALSRHKLMCIIKHDGSAYALNWLRECGLETGYQTGFVEGSWTKTLEALSTRDALGNEGLPIHAQAAPDSELSKEKFATNKVLARYTAKITDISATTEPEQTTGLPRASLLVLSYVAQFYAALHFLALVWPFVVLLAVASFEGVMYTCPTFAPWGLWVLAKIQVLSYGFSTHYDLWYADFCSAADCTSYLGYLLYGCSLVAWFWSSLCAAIWSAHVAILLGYKYFCLILDSVPIVGFFFTIYAFSNTGKVVAATLWFFTSISLAYAVYVLQRRDSIGLCRVGRISTALGWMFRPTALVLPFTKFFLFLVSRRWFPYEFYSSPVVQLVRISALGYAYFFWFRFFCNLFELAPGRYTDMVVNQAYLKDLYTTGRPDLTWITQRFSDYVFYFLPSPQRTVKELAPESDCLAEPVVQSPKDSHKLVDTLINKIAILAEGFGTSLNTLAAATIDGQFYSGVLDLDFVMPFNARGHPKSLKQRFRRFCVGNGFTFSKVQPMQLIQVVAGRYFNKKKSAPQTFGHAAQTQARTMVGEFFYEHCNEAAFDEGEVDQIMNEFLASSRAKSYQEQFSGFDNTDVRVVRFHLKDIFKPKISGITDFSKPGQGISAWSKDAQSMFGAAARVINARFLAVLKSHAIFDNRIDPEEMKARLCQAMADTGDVAINGVTDYFKFDSQQDRFTQEIERQALAKLGVSEDFIELYYSFRSHYRLIADGLAGRCNFEKPSGEPLTLLGNTLLAAVVTNYLLRGEGKVTIAMKGDDSFKRQNKLHIDTDRLRLLERFTCMQVKVSLEEKAEFCGFVICGTRFVDSIYRKLEKVLAHKFHDYAHFCEYRKSLIDWVKKNKAEDILVVAAYNAELYGGHFSQAMAAFDAVEAITHLNEEQFHEMFPEREEIAVFKAADGQFTV